MNSAYKPVIMTTEYLKQDIYSKADCQYNVILIYIAFL